MIRLRPLKKRDCKTMALWLPEERQFAMWSVGVFQYPLTVAQLEDYMAHVEEQEDAWSMAALDKEGKLVGHFAVRKADYREDSAYLGFIVVDPMQRGKGYGREMVSMAVRYAMETLGVKKVTLNVAEENRAALACYLSIGFKMEERIEKGESGSGEYGTLCRMKIDRESMVL